jgi:hypothetical protein
MTRSGCAVFDLERASLLFIDVYREGAELSQLTLSCPHSILDGWSVSNLVPGSSTRYAALLRGESSAAARRCVPCFREFIALEQAARRSESIVRATGMGVSTGHTPSACRASVPCVAARSRARHAGSASGGRGGPPRLVAAALSDAAE